MTHSEAFKRRLARVLLKTKVRRPGQVAETLGITRAQVERLCAKGELITYRTAGGHRRILGDSVKRLIKERRWGKRP